MKALSWIVVLLLCAAAAAPGKEVRKMGELKITSAAFADREAIPEKYTCDGQDVSPPLALDAIPAGTRSLALIVDDPDAPVGTWVHWVLWNIPPETRAIGESSVPTGAHQGRNDWKRNSYGGPCPPSGTHRYFFKIYALDAAPELGPSTTKADLERAMTGHILARGELVGTYRRK